MTVRWTGADGAEQSAECAVTPAHAAALDGRLRDEFRVIPADAWGEDQIEAGTYLEASRNASGPVAPFVWNLGAGDIMERAVFTRPVAFACWDRARSWRMLQELAGIENEYARRAADEARAGALADAEAAHKKLDADHQAEVEKVRASAAGGGHGPAGERSAGSGHRAGGATGGGQSGAGGLRGGRGSGRGPGGGAH
ncbi:MAG: hypothetical protein M5R36_24405 [Deltaproteobacteria bacterium]|nr:hypothetical protein [Deltaproteobacteria bacterium]